MKLNFAVFLVLTCLTLSSCSEFYFSSPQPNDSKDIYSVPNKYTGSWQTRETFDGRMGSLDSLIIDKKYYKHITRTIVKHSKIDLELDSSIYFINDKIYSNKDGEFAGGFSYTTSKGDSILVDMLEIETVVFGKTAFLRKFKYGYILNVNHEKMNGWWNVKFIDTRNKEGIIIRKLESVDFENDENHEILHEDFDKFIIASWTKEDFIKLIDGGGFSDTIMFLKYDEKNRN